MNQLGDESRASYRSLVYETPGFWEFYTQATPIDHISLLPIASRPVYRPGSAAEGVEGGFASTYPVLRALEEAGRIRRGYFVEGLGAAQFALSGALERLRTFREPDTGTPAIQLLAATDPARAAADARRGSSTNST